MKCIIVCYVRLTFNLHEQVFLHYCDKNNNVMDLRDLSLFPSLTGHGFGLIQELPPWYTLALAFQTLGVVYGDMGTSPLYVFSDVFSKVPITSEVDILGALSVVLYTIALVPLAKYVFIVLKANDNGEGMGFVP